MSCRNGWFDRIQAPAITLLVSSQPSCQKKNDGDCCCQAICLFSVTLANQCEGNSFPNIFAYFTQAAQYDQVVRIAQNTRYSSHSKTTRHFHSQRTKQVQERKADDRSRDPWRSSSFLLSDAVQCVEIRSRLLDRLDILVVRIYGLSLRGWMSTLGLLWLRWPIFRGRCRSGVDKHDIVGRTFR